MFKDFIDYIYFEVRKTPKVVFYVLLIQIFILLNIFVLPIIGKKIYLNQKEDPELANKINFFEKESLKRKLNKYALAIKLIKNYNPTSSSVKLIKVNFDNVNSQNFDPNLINVKHSIFLINNSDNTGSTEDYGTASQETINKFCMRSDGTNKLNHLREKGELEYGRIKCYKQYN